MKINVPWNDLFPQYRILVKYPGAEQSYSADDSHRIVEITLPAGVDENDVEIIGCPLDSQGQPAAGCSPCVIKARTLKLDTTIEPTSIQKAPRKRIVEAVEPVESVVEAINQPVSESTEDTAAKSRNES
jgi:hypothetical protein